MARNVTGWGRIELTELLLDTDDPEPEVCQLLLRDGANNDIMNEYTALSIATKCQLHEVLASSPGDPELIRGAGQILRALASGIGGGPAGDMLGYPEGGLATELFLQRFESAALTLDDFLVVDSIRVLSECDEDEDGFLRCGWNSQRRERIHEVCRRILAQPRWHELAREGLECRDCATHSGAMAVAKRLGIPLRAHIKERLEEEPLSNLWFELVHEAEEEQMNEALEMASRLLDLDTIATGPANELGLGPDYELHSCADWLLQDLRRFPGKGWEVIRPALRSPVVRNRNFAWKALAEWPLELLTHEIREALVACRDDPNEDVRQGCAEILSKTQRSQ